MKKILMKKICMEVEFFSTLNAGNPDDCNLSAEG
jgi:hypothetical protein